MNVPPKIRGETSFIFILKTLTPKKLGYNSHKIINNIKHPIKKQGINKNIRKNNINTPLKFGGKKI